MMNKANVFHMKMSSNQNSQANKISLIVHIFNKNLTLPKILDLLDMTIIRSYIVKNIALFAMLGTK